MEHNTFTTEQRNINSNKIDTKSIYDIIKIINSEDKKVPIAVEKSLDEIANVIKLVVKSFKSNGRLIYIGAGTSGRLGVLDASECPPTFGVSKQMVQGIIAGGDYALRNSVEDVEDDKEAGIAACKKIGLSNKDTLIGITANGGATFVIESLKYANSVGCSTAAISSNHNAKIFDVVNKQHRIFADVGPEIITGSTRMKSGTAQKLILNMITTTAMIKIGKVYNNWMIDLNPVNSKLVKRSINMICEITDCSKEEASRTFYESNMNVRASIIMVLLNTDLETAQVLLKENKGNINNVLDNNL
ncbi:MAG: N-acetylmuramic acid 6-phosphate etherase [Pleomorphochaeta sp.]